MINEINVTKKIYERLIIFHKYLYRKENYDFYYRNHSGIVFFDKYDDIFIEINNPDHIYYIECKMCKKDLYELRKAMPKIIELYKQKKLLNNDK